MKSPDQSDRLSIISFVILVGFFAGEVRNYLGGIYKKLPYPDNTYLFFPDVRFTDFTALVEGCSGLNPYFIPNPSGQFPFVNFVAYLFSTAPMGFSFLFYIALVVVPFFSLCLTLFRPFSRQYALNAVILTLLNYPVLFTIDRGNFEGLVFTLLLGFAYFIWRSRYNWAAAALGLAIALKGFPLVFIPILLIRKQFWQAGAAMLAGFILTVIPLALFEGGFMKNFEFLASGSNFAHPAIEMFLFPARTAQRGVSLFSFFKVVAEYLSVDVDFRSALPIYRKVAMVLYVPILWLTYRLRGEYWKMIGTLTIAALLLPHLSGHYKLIHMLIVALFFIIKEERGTLDFAYALILGLLMIPKPYFFLEHFTSDAPGHDLSIAMILDPLLLLGLLLLFTWERPLRSAGA